MSEPLKVTVSIGITGIHLSDNQIKHALSRADKALYHAKETGKDKACSCAA
ncbi:diguanylate cyclase [Vibrio sinaloensis]|nr:diguanylate cyclase [Vibrio sinaloensis]